MSVRDMTSRRRPLLEVSVPGWDEPAFLRVMSGAERADFSKFSAETDDADPHQATQWQARLLQLTVREKDGAVVFDDDEAAASLPIDEFDLLCRAAMDLNGLSAGSLEELAGKSEGTGSGASGSG